eukprot:6323374-Prymnesium_polylepis.1
MSEMWQLGHQLGPHGPRRPGNPSDPRQSFTETEYGRAVKRRAQRSEEALASRCCQPDITMALDCTTFAQHHRRRVSPRAGRSC